MRGLALTFCLLFACEQTQDNGRGAQTPTPPQGTPAPSSTIVGGENYEWLSAHPDWKAFIARATPLVCGNALACCTSKGDTGDQGACEKGVAEYYSLIIRSTYASGDGPSAWKLDASKVESCLKALQDYPTCDALGFTPIHDKASPCGVALYEYVEEVLPEDDDYVTTKLGDLCGEHLKANGSWAPNCETGLECVTLKDTSEKRCVKREKVKVATNAPCDRYGVEFTTSKLSQTQKECESPDSCSYTLNVCLAPSLPGANCSDSDHCVEGYQCKDPNPSNLDFKEDVCERSLPIAGEKCLGTGAQCFPGYYCEKNSGLCALKKKKGAACADYNECVDYNFYCSKVSNTCVGYETISQESSYLNTKQYYCEGGLFASTQRAGN